MTRRATALLEVEVRDQQLDAHLQKVQSLTQAWAYIGANVGSWTSGFSKGIGDEMQKVSRAIVNMSNVQAGGGAASVLQALGQSTGNIQSLASELDKVSVTTKSIADDTVRWMRALAKATDAVNKLQQHTQSLVNSQGATTKHITQFEQHLDAATLKLKTQGTELLRLIQAYAGFNKMQAQVTKASGTSTPSNSSAFFSTVADMERRFIRHATTFFIAGQWLKHAGEAFRDAAAEIDLENVLGRSVGDFGNLMERTRESTRGMVSDLQIMKSAALMSSFKIPMERFADTMSLVQKMAVRTGQDTTYMFDSLARGVARLSPAILDNLGIQIKLKEAYQAAAAVRGISLDQMDKEAQKIAVLEEVTRQMTDATKEVDPAASLQGRLDQMEAGLTNFVQKIKGGLLQAALLVAATEEERLSIVSDRLKLLALETKKYGDAVSSSAKNITVAIGGMTQKSLDMLLQFGPLNPMNVMQAAAQGKTVTAYLLDMAEAQGLVWRATGKTADEIERMQRLQEDRAHTERVLGALDERIVELNTHKVRVFEQLRLAFESYWDESYWKQAYGNQLAALEQQVVTLTNLRAVLYGAFRNLESFRASIGDMATNDFALDEGTTRVFETLLTEKVDSFRRQIEAIRNASGGSDKYGIMAQMLLGAGGEDYINRKLSEFAEESRNIAVQRMADFRKNHAAEMAMVDVYDAQLESIDRANSLRKGSTVVAFELTDIEKQLNEAVQKYADLRKDSKAYAEGESSVSNYMLEQARDMVIALQQQYAARFDSADIEKEFQKFLDSDLGAARELRDLEFERLSGGRSRAQIESEMIKLSGELLKVERERASVSRDMTESEFMFLAMTEADFETRIAKLQKLLDKAPKVGGGSSNKKGPKRLRDGWDYSDIEFQVKKLDNDTSRNYDKMLEIVQTSKDNFTQIITSFEYDVINGVTKSTSSLESTVSRLTGGKGLLGAFLGNENLDQKIEDNDKLLLMIEELADKYGELSPGLIAFRDETELANEALREHRDVLLAVAKATEQWATANQWAFEGAQGLIGQDFIDGFTGLGNAVMQVSEKIQAATKGEANGYDMLVAGLGGIRAFSNAFIKDRRDRAKIEMFMNGAAAFAAAGYGNWPAAAAHAQAAIMYGLVAGGRVRLPSEARRDTKDAATARPTSGPLHIHIEAPAGMTEGQMGYSIERSIEIARAEGRL